MRGDYDTLLEWPFRFKVIFSLLDQSTIGNDWSKFFWSDRESICFQRPQLKMNECYGIEKFISIEQFQQNRNRYVQDDTMFIKIEVDFHNRLSGMLIDGEPHINTNEYDNLRQSFSIGMLINDEQHTDTNEDDILRRYCSFD